MKAKVVTETKLFLVCPFCEKGQSSIEHLEIGRSFGPWSCDECGHYYQGVRTDDGADIDKTEETCEKVLILLEYVNDSRLRLIVEGHEFSRNEEPGHEYYYNEHTCPTNYLQRVKQIILQKDHFDDHDPHGVFRFVRRATEADLDENAQFAPMSEFVN